MKLSLTIFFGVFSAVISALYTFSATSTFSRESCLMVESFFNCCRVIRPLLVYDWSVQQTATWNVTEERGGTWFGCEQPFLLAKGVGGEMRDPRRRLSVSVIKK